MFTIEYTTQLGYTINENGRTLPMIFTTYDAAARQVRFLDAAKNIATQPVTARESGDLEYPRQRRTRP